MGWQGLQHEDVPERLRECWMVRQRNVPVLSGIRRNGLPGAPGERARAGQVRAQLRAWVFGKVRPRVFE